MNNQPECVIDQDGSKRWYLNGKRHREDGPAREGADGTKEWYLNDKQHREGGPAVEYADGTKEWWVNGQLHREDGPAIEDINTGKQWFLNGNEVEPESIVDLWLSRGVFCYFDDKTQTLNFGEKQ